MHLSHFLAALFDHGRVPVGPWMEEHSTADQAAAVELLRHRDEVVRLHFSGEAPHMSLEAALWGASALYRACQLLIFRDLGADQIAAAFDAQPLERSAPAAHYSVDLTLAFLPDVWRLASAAAREDPLLDALRQLGREWPLSSVGLPEVASVDPTPLVEHGGLLRCYVDRIIAHGDRSRLDAPRIRSAVQAALGDHVALAPQLASVLTEFSIGALECTDPPTHG